ncbi:hypothetical protein SLEP1_g56264 [Rubroshorea leprosula]|uniref:Uncharacterized protein n=1 Tax=Rubroshorea leprosula TaxID=152421 RepID=A0AAV5MJ26_9ROSI|nr:hypothetical protein SLEP1_g56264 [Rubroshorea leprosula]
MEITDLFNPHLSVGCDISMIFFLDTCIWGVAFGGGGEGVEKLQ